MTNRALALIVAAVAVGLACLAGPILLSQQAISVCPPAAAASGATDADWDDEQLTNAAAIINVGISLGVPERGQIIAVATAMQESSLRNLPHLGEDNDRDSLGLFQQRPSMGWGTREQIMDPQYASTVFYERLLQVPDWEDLPLTEAAQQVQRSAYPDAYAKWEDDATALVRERLSSSQGGQGLDLAACAPVEGWTRPVPGEVTSGFRTANRPTHYGIDTADLPGVQVRAAAAGTVVAATCNATLNGQPYSCDQPGSVHVAGCGWYVDILHGSDQQVEEGAGVVTRYCHLLTRPQVQAGDQVSAGQPIGMVGTSGHSSGPHLHFEVELRRIIERHEDGTTTVERRQTDPIAFMAARGVVFTCITTAADCEPVHGDRVRTERR
jgi:murein DD-endopeptidase MepM/ murein hydrolase activator NlpD